MEIQGRGGGCQQILGMTNLSTLRPHKNSSSKKGKLFTPELALALALGGQEGVLATWPGWG